MGIINKMFGTYSERELKKIYPVVDKIEALDEEYSKLTNAELKAKTSEFKERLQNGETLDDIMVEAFATAREASWRVLGMKPFRVQLVGGIILQQGRIAEIKTGEGKTLTSVAPAYLNALTGNGVHIVTVNDYLAKRDSEWMGKVHRFLGLTVGLITHDVSPFERQKEYNADITYATNNELGFDYLRDNMAINKNQIVQRGQSFAIVDEVDSILIDEARTPLIISGHGEDSSDLYTKVDNFVSSLRPAVFASIDERDTCEDVDADYIVVEKDKSATLTAEGIKKAELAFQIENIADPENSTIAHHINQAMRAHGLMKKDVDYVERDGEIIIVDEFTGRLMFGRRYNDGLHQAIEAKEHVKIKNENKTLASVTFQNYFRLYDKLSGMTGTALTEEEEFNTIYTLDIIAIPTNKPVIRIDNTDVIFKNEHGKFDAVIQKIITCHEKGQPILVGTVSVEKSEYLSALLKKQGIKHSVLNAKNNEKEAEIIAQAGKFGAVTIATNMAGRGTDIMLGGNPEYMAKNDMKKEGFDDDIISNAIGYAETDDEDILAARKFYNEKMIKYKKITSEEAEQVRAAGGLYIIGTERHESRRIDNQLRGRSGRQGDPGETTFFVAMTDDVMRLFGSERAIAAMDSLGIEDDMPIDLKMISNAIEQAQKAIESNNFAARRDTIEYDDVLNKQREIIYGERRRVLNGEDVSESVKGMIHEYVTECIIDNCEDLEINTQEQLDNALKEIETFLVPVGSIKLEMFKNGKVTREDLVKSMTDMAEKIYEAKTKILGNNDEGMPVMKDLERIILLRAVDTYWMDNIDAMTELRKGIVLRAYANVKPIDAYKKESGEMFDEMTANIRKLTAKQVFLARVIKRQAAQAQKNG